MVRKSLKQNKPRILPILASLVVLLCCVFPAAAADAGSSSSMPVYSVLPFDRLTVAFSSSDEVCTFPWLAGSFYDDGGVSLSTVEVGSFTLSSSGTLSSGVASVSLSPSWSMAHSTTTLELDRLIISDAQLSSSSWALTLGGGNTGNVRISFNLNIVEKVNDQYQVRAVPIVTSSTGTSFDITGSIYRAIHASGAAVTSCHYLSDLSIMITGVSAPGTFSVSTSVVSGSYVADLGQWFNSWGIQYLIYQASDPGDLDFSWLVSAASQMLEIQLWPGFTIGGSLRIIFIIGLLFWFLKLTF